ncbi:TIGR03960 family B12-binding radical SAM protein [Phascolarctobacterium sp.]|uniref:TIGR03960 family B12-binding radical SAM protein n=1 Tax=Phascolarctobacterium sp. TaxID=2049039 RepID=UPI002A83ED6A|nr:TIGR03960 family B12-binding radical SAM protein [Phascolarctobacterium sp.]MDY5045661.1 TIGR03960 family B12-binding radical SAM protein [Phascolarctobacterium sp.]
MEKELTIDILSSVQKPARYTGGEFASIIKPADEVEATICLAFPDVYEVGMSYLGFKILYHLLNKQQGVQAERVYAPWIDMEAKMRERHIPLRTLETKKTLKECDIVGFTLQYELSYTNILNMLDLGGVPVLAAERTEEDPLVIVGGPCVYNPEPLADFFDFAIIGEGEEVMAEVMEAYKAWKRAGKPGGRQAFLQEVVKINGIYVPSFYEVEYNENLTVKAVRPVNVNAPAVVYKRVVRDMNSVDFPTSPIVPFGEIVHDRIMLEVFRGCSRGCRFCHAGMVYRPVRERKPEVLKDLARQLVDNTGYNEISLVSLSSADYSCLAPMVHDMIDEFKDDRVSVSLPSLRIDSFCVAIAKEIQAVRKSGLTFAPEAGSQKMRDVINKGVTEEDLMNAVGAAFASGWNSVKLYFMIGLPFENDDDVLAIADLARKVQYKYYQVTGKRGCKVTCSASFFVPKPYTAFQWFAQDDLENIRRKQFLLKDEIKTIKNVTLNYHDSKTGIIEAVFARGDRKVGKALLLAWQKGARFDGWSDCFDYERWLEAFAEAGLDKDFYAARQRGEHEVFPWEHISPGVSRKFLWNEWQKAYSQQLTHDCRRSTCTGCGVCQKLGVNIIDYKGEVEA